MSPPRTSSPMPVTDREVDPAGDRVDRCERSRGARALVGTVRTQHRDRPGQRSSRPHRRRLGVGRQRPPTAASTVVGSNRTVPKSVAVTSVPRAIVASKSNEPSNEKEARARRHIGDPRIAVIERRKMPPGATMPSSPASVEALPDTSGPCGRGASRSRCRAETPRRPRSVRRRSGRRNRRARPRSGWRPR